MRRSLPFLSALFWLLAALAITPASARGLSNGIAGACVLGSPEPLTLASAMAQSRWNCDATKSDLEHDYVWLRFDPDRMPVGDSFNLTSDAAAFDGLRYHLSFADGTARYAHLTERDIARLWQPQTNFAIPLYSAAERPASFFVRIDRPLTIQTATRIEIRSTRSVAQSRSRGLVLFGLFVGMMLTAGLYSAIVFGGMRNKFAAWHFVMAVLFVVHTAFSGSLVFLIWPDMSLFARTALSCASLSLAAATIPPFFFSFVAPEHIQPGLRKALMATGLLLIANAFLFAAFGRAYPFEVRPIYHLMYLPGLTVFALNVLASWRLGSRPVRWIAAAWILPVGFAFERALRGMNLYQAPGAWDHAFYYALAYMAIVMAFAVAWRVSDLRRDRDRAIAMGSELNRQALSDSLTGLPNRRAFGQRKWRDGDFLAIVDVDLFKRVNDDFGHQTGDDVLQAIGRCLLSQTDQQELIGAWRMGGEEFAVLMDAADMTAAAARLNDLRGRISAQIATEVPAIDRPITLSMGLAKITRGRVEQTYEQADRALYRAKAAGRDRLSYQNHESVLATIFPSRAA